MLTALDLKHIGRLVDEELARIEAARTTAPGSVRAATVTEAFAIDGLTKIRERLGQQAMAIAASG